MLDTASKVVEKYLYQYFHISFKFRWKHFTKTEFKLFVNLKLFSVGDMKLGDIEQCIAFKIPTIMFLQVHQYLDKALERSSKLSGPDRGDELVKLLSRFETNGVIPELLVL